MGRKWHSSTSNRWTICSRISRDREGAPLRWTSSPCWWGASRQVMGAGSSCIVPTFRGIHLLGGVSTSFFVACEPDSAGRDWDDTLSVLLSCSVDSRVLPHGYGSSSLPPRAPISHSASVRNWHKYTTRTPEFNWFRSYVAELNVNVNKPDDESSGATHHKKYYSSG